MKLQPTRLGRLRDLQHHRLTVDAAASPASARSTSTWSVNPASGKVYVSNTEAINEVRFEGPGTIRHANGFKPLGEPASVIGHSPRSADQHHRRPRQRDPAPPEQAHRLRNGAEPRGHQGRQSRHADGDGNHRATARPCTWPPSARRRSACSNTALLENDTLRPLGTDAHFACGGGPPGLVLDEANDRLYVLDRFDNTISVVDTIGQTEVSTEPLHNPEPANVVDGRPVSLRRDAQHSSNGEASCSSLPRLWRFRQSRLGSRQSGRRRTHVNNMPVNNPVVGHRLQGFPSDEGPDDDANPARHEANHGAMHWRGDRSVGFFGNDPRRGALVSTTSSSPLTVCSATTASSRPPRCSSSPTSCSTSFLPPNPIRPLDNSLPGSAEAAALALYGTDALNGHDTDSGVASCQRLPPTDAVPRILRRRRWAQLRERNPALQGTAPAQPLPPRSACSAWRKVPFVGGGDNGFKGPQIRGFGMLHDGSDRHRVPLPRRNGLQPVGLTAKRPRSHFILQFDTEPRPDRRPADHSRRRQQRNRRSAHRPADRSCQGLLRCPRHARHRRVRSRSSKGTTAAKRAVGSASLQGPCGPGQTMLFQGDRAGDALLTDAQLRP